MADTHQGNLFIDQLLHDLRLDQLPEPRRTELLNKITELAERRVLQTIVMNMDRGALDEFEKKLQSGMSEGEAVRFMMEKVPGLSTKVEAALRDLYQELLADVQEIDQKIDKLPETAQPATQRPTPSSTPLVMPPISGAPPTSDQPTPPQT